MANIFERLFSRQRQLEQISSQLQDMQSNYGALAQQNSILQQQLAINFRSQGGFTKYDYNNQIGYIKSGQQLSTAVYSITKRIARTAAMVAPLKVYQVVDDAKVSKYFQLKSNPTPENLFKADLIRTKALQDVPEDNKLQLLLDNPNAQDDKSTFYETLILFRLITGNSYLWTPTLDMGADKGTISEMYILPSQFTGIVTTNSFPKKVLGYEVIIDGVQLVQSSEVIHWKYANLDYTMDGQELYGLSPLKAAAKTLLRANDSEDSAVSQLRNNGPAVIVYNESVQPDDMGNDQIGKIKQSWQSEYAGSKNRAKIKLSAGKVGVAPLGISPVELDLLAGEQWAMDMLCNAYGVSTVMFNNHEASTDNNVLHLRKDFLTNAVLPEKYALRDAFNRHITPLFNKGGKKFIIDVDLSQISELQPDLKTLSEWLNLSPEVTLNERRLMKDLPPSTDPLMDKVWINKNMVLLENAALPPQQPAKPGDANKPTDESNPNESEI